MGLAELVLKDKSDDIESRLPAYWFLTLVVSGVVFFLSLAGTFIIAIVYFEQYDFYQMLYYGTIVSLIAPLGPIRSIMEAIQSRNMNFKQISLVSIFSFALGIVPSLFLAAYGYDNWAMVAKFLLPHFFYIPLGLFIYRLKIRVEFQRSIFQNIKQFSGYFSLNSLINYLVRNIDYLIIGKFFPAAVLGQYTIAYKILLFPMRNITARIVQISTPILVKMNFQGKEFKRKYFLIVQTIAAIVFPLMLFLFLVRFLMVGVVFGDQYSQLPIMISYLAVLGAVQALVSPVGVLYIFREEMKLMTTNSLVALLVFTCGLIWSSTSGKIQLVMSVYALSYVFFIMPNSQYWIFKRYGFSMRDFYEACFPYIIACVPSFVISWGWLNWVSKCGPIGLLCSSGGVFVVVYFVVLKLLNHWSSEERFYMVFFRKLGF